MTTNEQALKEALENIVNNFTHNAGGPEILRSNELADPPYVYYSPMGALVGSEHIAHAREVLKNINE